MDKMATTWLESLSRPPLIVCVHASHVCSQDPGIHAATHAKLQSEAPHRLYVLSLQFAILAPRHKKKCPSIDAWALSLAHRFSGNPLVLCDWLRQRTLMHAATHCAPTIDVLVCLRGAIVHRPCPSCSLHDAISKDLGISGRCLKKKKKKKSGFTA